MAEKPTDSNGSDEGKTAHDWWGPEDEGNPQNWATPKKLYHVLIPPAVGFLCPFGSSVYTPSHEQVMRDFSVTRFIAILPFCFYLLGLSFGPIIAAPTSETYGRKMVYVSALPLFAAFTLGAGFSQGIASLIVCRFFAGLFSSPGLSIGTGTISDLYLPEKRGGPMSIFVTMVQMGPAFGPVIGGFVTINESWRWTQWVILMGIAIVMMVTIPMSETYKKTILKKRAKKLGIPGPEEPERTLLQTIKFFVVKTITRPIHMLFTEPIVTAFDLWIAFNFGLLNAFFAAFSWVFQNVYGFGIGSTGLTYIGQAVGSLIGLVVMLCTYRIYWTKEAAKAKQNGEKMSPDKRLFVAKIGAPFIPVSLFWFGWSARPSVHWIVPVIAEGFFSFGNLLVFTCASLYLTDCYGAIYGASAWSSNTSLRYLAAFAFPLFAVQMYEALGTGWATSLIGFVSLLTVPIPFIFGRYGPRLRQKSSYASQD
ncbi:Polyamine transporter 4 [Pseudocercospora fuligena]|uniref:Cercosporin MFS transporter CTB4 n=1 Tax=Pseudocercospora fuligena TaxID=685502 RepID=A0A8H6VJC4_9PEZI|nr:Polyamine transporter 4 [Pseudocercospora fuligena]